MPEKRAERCTRDSDIVKSGDSTRQADHVFAREERDSHTFSASVSRAPVAILEVVVGMLYVRGSSRHRKSIVAGKPPLYTNSRAGKNVVASCCCLVL